MSLFVDLRQINKSVSNLSNMVDKISTSTLKDKVYERKKSIDSALYGSSIFKPTTLGFGVKFSQSQENIYENMPSSRLRSHMSLPNLGKSDHKPTINSKSRPKIVEIDDDEDSSDGNKKETQINSEYFNHCVVACLNKRPHFDDTGSTHPIDFLDNVKYYISELNIALGKQLPFIIACLDGLPLMWARCFKNEFKSVDNFYDAFEQEFWGPDRQKSILYDLKLGKYEEDKTRMSMSEYFLYKVSNYKHLTPPPSDLEIVYSLAAHFPSAVELELRLTPKPTLREAYSLLRRREGEANDFLPNYLYEMCEAFQKGLRPDSARRACDDCSASTCRKHAQDK